MLLTKQFKLMSFTSNAVLAEDIDAGIVLANIPEHGYRIKSLDLSYDLMVAHSLSSTDSTINEIKDSLAVAVESIKELYSVDYTNLTLYGIVVSISTDPNSFKPLGNLSVAYNLSSD